MKQKPSHIIYIMMLLCIAFSSCEKLEIPDNSKVETNDSSDNGGTTTIQALTISEAVAVYNETKEKVSNKYVVGYIVGYVSGTSIKSTTFSAGNSKTNIVIAETPVETDYNKCFAVQLCTDNQECSNVRNKLNLDSHPEMLGTKVRIKGDIDSYMKAIGLTKARDYAILEDDFDYDAWKNNNDNKEDSTSNGNVEDNTVEPQDTTIIYGPTDNPTDDPKENQTDKPSDEASDETNNNSNNFNDIRQYIMSHGTDFNNPFKVYDLTFGAIKQYNDSIEIGSISGCYVKGYIVGYVKGNKIETAMFNAGDIASNVLLADKAQETDFNNCIAIQMPTSPASCKKVRAALNLVDNPSNLGKEVIIRGTIQKYMGKLGVKEANDYKFVE